MDGGWPADGHFVSTKRQFSKKVLLERVRDARRHPESGLVVLRGARLHIRMGRGIAVYGRWPADGHFVSTDRQIKYSKTLHGLLSFGFVSLSGEGLGHALRGQNP